MITTRSPYQHPEFIRTVNYIPFDAASDAERERWDMEQARFRFNAGFDAYERNRNIRTTRMILGVLAGCFVFWAAAAAWLLL
jgi:hypothetical protein